MSDLNLPLPYAFNYHYEGGLFRGLAFGNFRAPEEAARVIVGLNGITMLGRSIKVEYKKALPGMTPAECMARHQSQLQQNQTIRTPQDVQNISGLEPFEDGEYGYNTKNQSPPPSASIQQQYFTPLSRDGMAGTVRPRKNTISNIEWSQPTSIP